MKVKRSRASPAGKSQCFHSPSLPCGSSTTGFSPTASAQPKKEQGLAPSPQPHPQGEEEEQGEQQIEVLLHRERPVDRRAGGYAVGPVEDEPEVSVVQRERHLRPQLGVAGNDA